jgi:HAMP domain-containing protein
LQGGKGGAEFRDELGKLMVGAYAPVPKFGWGVVVEEPIASAYFELRRLETNSLLFVIAGIAMTALVGIFFAHSLEKPIKELTVGTEAVAHGDLHWSVSVDSLDEIGRLAAAFN